MVYYLHIPKTAGTSVKQIISRNYQASEVVFIGVHWTTWLGHGEVKERLDISPDAKLVHAHLSYGVHEHVAGKYSYATMLRNPCDRIVSGYHHLRRHKKNELQQIVQHYSLEEYINSHLVLDVDNGMVRRLSGVMDSVPFGGITSEHLELARKNLEHDFVFVGTQERFDESLYLLAENLSWKHRHYTPEKQRARRAKQEHSQVSPRVLRKIDELNRYDHELYSYAADRLAAEIQESDFNSRVFHVANTLYGLRFLPGKLTRKTARRLRSLLGLSRRHLGRTA
jgi:hypothetical protein